MKQEINIGDRFVCKNEGNAFGGIVINISKIEVNEENYLDSYAHFRTEERIHNRKNQKVRFWWLLEYCNRSNFKQFIKAN